MKEFNREKNVLNGFNFGHSPQTAAARRVSADEIFAHSPDLLLFRVSCGVTL